MLWRQQCTGHYVVKISYAARAFILDVFRIEYYDKALSWAVVAVDSTRGRRRLKIIKKKKKSITRPSFSDVNYEYDRFETKLFYTYAKIVHADSQACSRLSTA